MLLQRFLEDSAARRPDEIALVCGAQRLTYRRLDEAADKLASALRELGVRRGDRVGIYLANSPEAVVSIFAVLKASAVFVAVHRQTKPEKLAAILGDCKAAAAIVDAKGADERLLAAVRSLRALVACGDGADAGGDGSGAGGRVRSLAEIQAASPSPRPRPENIDLDLATLVYTSGTTGEPKGVMCDHGSMTFVTDAVARYLGNSPADVVLSALPLAYSYGLYQLLAMFRVGGRLVLEPSFAFPGAVVETLARERATGFAGVPMMYSLLLGLDASAFDLSALRYMTNAAAGLPVEHVKRLRRAFPRTDLYLMHGLTEVARTMVLPPGEVDRRPASSGLALPGTELWLEDEEGRRVGPGEAGELVVRGPHVMRGYWDAPELSAARFRPGRLPGERLCYSGDLFRTDEEGYFYFVSRKDEIIKCRGEKVAPREVEDVLLALPGVQDAAVVGVPDPLLGQAVKAVIVAPGGGLTDEVVISHCKAHLEEHMVPRIVEFRRELPKTGSGKLRRRDLL